MGAHLYFNLNDEQRDGLVKILAPHLPVLMEAAEKLRLFEEIKKKKKTNNTK